MDEEADGRRRRGLVLAAIVLLVGVPVLVTLWLSERNVDRDAGQLAEELRRAGRQVNDVDALAEGGDVFSSGEPAQGPLVDALGHSESLTGYAVGATGLSVSYEVRWGLAARCVHLLLRDDSPVRTTVTDSATCRPLSVE